MGSERRESVWFLSSKLKKKAKFNPVYARIRVGKPLVLGLFVSKQSPGSHACKDNQLKATKREAFFSIF